MNATTIRGNGASITSLNATNISTGTINTARLPSDVVKTTGNQTIAGIKTFSSPLVGAEPTANNHLATKNYVDTLVTSGVTWKAPVALSAAATYGACDAAKE